MLDSKTRNEILLEEKVAKIDDINFDKIYDVDEFATKQLESFEDVKPDLEELSTKKIEDFDDDVEETTSSTTAFELELQPNEFLDNMVWGEDEEIEEIHAKRKFSLVNKPLFYAFTSIAFLLCILFIYNVFVIKSLEGSIASNASSGTGGNVSIIETENNNITFDNGNTTEIESNKNYINNSNKNINIQTNWFNELCNKLNQLFGGNY